MKAERGGRPWRSVARASRVALVGAFQEQRAIRCALPCRKLAWTDAMVPQTGSFADKSRGIADMTNRFARAKVGRLPTSQRGGGKDLCGGRDDADGTPTSSRYLTSVEDAGIVGVHRRRQRNARRIRLLLGTKSRAMEVYIGHAETRADIARCFRQPNLFARTLQVLILVECWNMAGILSCRSPRGAAFPGSVA